MLICFYGFWHGHLRLKGAGFLIRILAPYSRSLQRYPLQLPEGQTVHLDFRDISAWYWLNYTLGDSVEEAGLVEALCSSTKSGDVIWDIGANSGLFAYLIAQMLPDCRIFFFEPNRSVYDIACSALLPFKNVTGLNIGLSSTTRKKALMVVPCGGSTVGTLEPEALGRIGSTVEIDIDTGDRLVQSGELPAPDVVKIDVEGHEANTLAGLTSIISENRPKVFFEHLSLSDNAVTDLVPSGYMLCSVSDRSGEITPTFDRSAGHNSVLLPSSACDNGISNGRDCE